ncbi:DNA alkylation repair protein [Diaminobutyricimonas sp. LJ205]|uniref:DNA alkylation repair protein n=1 Tax=Diaminobutyricimonas sp. LJ205 TaxID=2683590 RepID=UPI0018E04B86|nr:DNA alkylation repair protein [Diaminobutyricimonas sp. LJ205]
MEAGERSRTRDEPARAALHAAYLDAVRAGRVNNWDLVDCSAEYLVGEYLAGESQAGRSLVLLDDLAASESLWERRVAVLATFAFIKQGDAAPTLHLAERLLADREDLIHKAVGWMLREVGKRVDRATLTGFLDAQAARMPRTMLSYATEHLDPAERAHYRALRAP